MVILYSNDCPRCQVVKQMMKKYGMEFTEIDNPQPILDRGYTTYPVIQIGDTFYDYSAFLTYLKHLKEDAQCK